MSDTTVEPTSKYPELKPNLTSVSANVNSSFSVTDILSPLEAAAGYNNVNKTATSNETASHNSLVDPYMGPASPSDSATEGKLYGISERAYRVKSAHCFSRDSLGEFHGLRRRGDLVLCLYDLAAGANYHAGQQLDGLIGVLANSLGFDHFLPPHALHHDAVERSHRALLLLDGRRLLPAELCRPQHKQPLYGHEIGLGRGRLGLLEPSH